MDWERLRVYDEAVYHHLMTGDFRAALEALVRHVSQGLRRLDKAERALLMMRYDTGLPIADMADILGISVATVRRRLAAALQRLREVMHRDA